MGQYLPMFPRSAVVTGGASGIGAAVVALLRAEGADVQTLDLAEGFDVADPRAWEDVGAVDFICLNAGVRAVQAPAAEHLRTEWPSRFGWVSISRCSRAVPS